MARYDVVLTEYRSGTTYDVHDHAVLVDGYEVPVRCVVPRSTEATTFPVFVYFHGGCLFKHHILS